MLDYYYLKNALLYLCVNIIIYVLHVLILKAMVHNVLLATVLATVYNIHQSTDYPSFCVLRALLVIQTVF